MSLARYLSKLGARLLSDGKVPTSALGAGAVLQVVQASVSSTQQSTTSASFIDANGLSASITPSSVNSKILVIADIEAGMGASGNNTTNRYRVMRDSVTEIALQTARHYDYGSSGVYGAQPIAITKLDSPNTISPVNYKVQFKMESGSSAFINAENGISSITLMEIAG